MEFIGNTTVTLHPGTTGYPVTFHFSTATAKGNDGSLPFGSVILSATVLVAAFGGEDISTAAVDMVTVDGGAGTVRIWVSHAPVAKKGPCKVMVGLTLSSGAVITKRWDGLVMG